MRIPTKLATATAFAALAACGGNNTANNMAYENTTEMNAGVTEMNATNEMYGANEMNMTNETGATNAMGNATTNNVM